uniref:DOG1 domain-containing protein n=1 Tax=Fagus sylvatica TaxID=28930 RepID=A0A2N9HW61_FAGSY
MAQCPLTTSMASNDQERSKCCFLKWMNLQQEELSELHQALTHHANNHINLTQLVEKCIKHFQDYADKRSQLAQDGVSAFFAPTWCTNWENSLLWIAGCRPSQYIRLVYALTGLEIEAQLNEFLQGKTAGKLGEISAKQLHQLDSLQAKTIRAEEKLTSRLASLQEDVADQPFAMIAKGLYKVGEMNGELDKALDQHEKAMVSVLEEVDRLRLSTVKELMGILTPLQAVDFLAAGKKLQLCVHEWGKRRDMSHGRGKFKNIN